MMKRLIDANALEADCNIFDAWDAKIVKAWLEDQPTVDAVEVVRCKDCRWARPQDHREPTCTPAGALICQCFMHHHIPAPWGARLAVNPDFFCAHGERRA